MQHPKDLPIAHFSYVLPDEKIAKYPLAQRDASKLLVYDKGVITEASFNQIDQYVPNNALLVFNNSKVIQSRLCFTKPSGGAIEIFILEPGEEYGDITTAMKQQGTIRCNCLVGGAKKWKAGKLQLTLSGHVEPLVLFAEIIEKKESSYLIEFNWHPEVDFATALELFGHTPIPPYLHRPSDETDKLRYQTIYAKENGSVAAPTAGLHFTPQVMERLQRKNIVHEYVTLHVGAGTFKPVKSETIAGHDMHAEHFIVTASLLQQLLDYDEIIAVGTTSMRTIESLYWMGVQTILNPNSSLDALEIKQWDVYDDLAGIQISKQEALTALLQKIDPSNGLGLRTQIMIAPPYKPRIATGIVTNFHQPQSTLLLLIAALIGEDWKKMYAYALAHDFRFLSYGDSSFIKW